MSVAPVTFSDRAAAPRAAGPGIMQNPKHLSLLINVAGSLVGIAVVAYVVYAAFHTDVAQACSARYPAGTRFSLSTADGKPLTAIQLQARAGARDMGVIDNASVIQVDGAPSPEVLEVKLRKLPGDADTSATARNGIAFHWAPLGLGDASSACLTYSLWLPDKFAFGDGGVLPGIFARVPGTPADAASEQLSVTPQWDGEGRPLLGATLRGGGIRRMTGTASPLPTNRWFKVEQEIVLSDPGKPNGVARVWIDGELAVEDERAPLRRDAEKRISGVLVEAGYRRAPAEPGILRLSPFEISVK
jgi:hypothetical protein